MPQNHSSSSARSPWIMVLDSSEAIQDSCRRTAYSRGLKCVVATSVPDALARVYAQKPAAILVNAAIPVMPGKALVAALQACNAFRAIPIGVMISSEEAKEQFEDTPPMMFLDRKEDFSASVGEFLDVIELESASSGMGGTERAPRVLLAEDSPTNQLILARMLHVAGADVTVVSNGLEALAAVEDTAFDMVMMDIEMPRMDGIEATARMRALGVQLPIIAITGYEADHEFSGEFHRDIDAFIEKPTNPPRLREVVQRFMGTKHSEAA